MLGIRKKMGKMGRKRIIKKEEEEEKVVANEEEDETPVKVEVPKSQKPNKKDIVNFKMISNIQDIRFLITF